MILKCVENTWEIYVNVIIILHKRIDLSRADFSCKMLQENTIFCDGKGYTILDYFLLYVNVPVWRIRYILSSSDSENVDEKNIKHTLWR